MKYVYFAIIVSVAWALTGGFANANPAQCGHPGKIGGEQAAKHCS